MYRRDSQKYWNIENQKNAMNNILRQQSDNNPEESNHCTPSRGYTCVHRDYLYLIKINHEIVISIDRKIPDDKKSIYHSKGAGIKTLVCTFFVSLAGKGYNQKSRKI